MLIPIPQILQELQKAGVVATGAFHIGAHECEELPFYTGSLGLNADSVVWVDAIPAKVEEAKAKGIKTIYNAVVTDVDDAPIVFNVSNNVQSSSVLEFGTHSREHPHVVYTSTINANSVTIDSFFQRNGIDASKCNIWNFDIQGAELMALRGATKSIKHAHAIYLEVNERELYKKCGLIGEIDSFLGGHGFKRVLTEMTRHGWGDALYVRV